MCMKRSSPESDDDRQQAKRRENIPPLYIKSLDDLIDFAWHCEEAGPDWFQLWKAICPLEELRNVVGMESVKETIVDIVLSHIQNLGEKGSSMHTMIVAPSGYGKTTLIEILARLYAALGIISRGHIVRIRRQNVVAQWLGHTEEKIKNLLESSKGGILLIDEAYTLGHKDRLDNYSQVIIDSLVKFLEESDVVCIIAGYENNIEQNLFQHNQGLYRRFKWKFKIDKYTSNELCEIFFHFIRRDEWILERDAINASFFQREANYFESAAGDVENFLNKCKICHGRRIFGKSPHERKILSKEDIERGFEQHKKNYIKNIENDTDIFYKSMFS
jgi:stage V sporulation protein K